MIIDTTPLSGIDAYLVTRDEHAAGYLAPSDPAYLNLARPDRTGSSPALYKGQAYEVEGVELTIVCPALDALWRRSAEPLISIDLHKQVFPGLFGDPYRQRAHTIGGQDDFARGTLTNLRIMDVDSRPTLVTTGVDKCRWLSPQYRLAEPARFAAAAWELATTRLTPDAGFQYFLTIHHWPEGAELSDPGAANELVLTSSAGPRSSRARADLGDELTKVVAYQVELGALVSHDTFLQERHGGPADAPSLGTPLLRAVSLLEDRPPSLTFHSLPELLTKASNREIVTAADGSGSLWIELDVRATLLPQDTLSLTVQQRGAELFSYTSARLLGRAAARPPRD